MPLSYICMIYTYAIDLTRTEACLLFAAPSRYREYYIRHLPNNTFYLVGQVYFNYLQIWMCGLQNLPEMSKRLKNALEEEWKFIKVVCPHVRGGEANASNRFWSVRIQSFLCIS